MDSARLKATGEAIEAETLGSDEEVVDHDAYICRGCPVKVTPAAYSPTNRVRPYFRLLPGTDHTDECGVDLEKRLIAKARKERVSNERNTLPFPHVSRLVLINRRTVLDHTAAPTGERGQSADRDGKAASSSEGEAMGHHRRVANTIRPICRTFRDFPFDRTLDLEVPNVDGTNYLTVFKKLAHDQLRAYKVPKIFYAPVRFNTARVTDNTIEVDLDAGTREGRKLKVGHKLVIDCTGWSKGKRTMVLNELEAARQEAMEANREGRKEKALVFFAGTQDPRDIAVFHLSDYRLVCCLSADMKYPRY